MVEELNEFSAGEFETVSELLASDPDLQLLMVILGVGWLYLQLGTAVLVNGCTGKSLVIPVRM